MLVGGFVLVFFRMGIRGSFAAAEKGNLVQRSLQASTRGTDLMNDL